MNLNAPKNVTFFISVILIVGGLISFFTPIGEDAILITSAGGILLILGNLLRGL